jgi:cysteine sulfinate desulfinase/cysteine desulfurase-like protein/glyoxylase-like metal-dependent hydrolase (beta-lactamase superfamily II)/rhodanese-related sulfurtransferase
MNNSCKTNNQPLSLVYLDANATTPVLPEAAIAALNSMETVFGNPSSSHISGLQAKQVMNKARQQALRVIGAGCGKIIFTSGATEGIQTAILSALQNVKKTVDNTKKYTLLYGATEHKAVPESLKHWNEVLELNAEVKAIPVNSSGELDTEFIAKEVANALMICTMAVNNETGVFQDITLLDNIIRQHNPHIAWMVDCVQALGKKQLNLANTSIDYAPFSGHKLYAPKGIGFVYIREGAAFTPVIAGGGQENGFRSGTENIPGLAALSEIFSILLGESKLCFASEETLTFYRDKLVHALREAFPSITFNHNFSNSVATTLNFAIPGFSSKEIMDLFDAANIRVSSGSACSSKVTRSFVLDAMGLPAWQSESAIRMSFGPATTELEIDTACERITATAQALENTCLTLNTKNENFANSNVTNVLDGLIQFKVEGNCSWLYVDKQTKTAILIDPLPEVTDRLKTLLICQDITLTAVIDTHGHADHQSCRAEVVESCGAFQETDLLGWPTHTPSLMINQNQYSYLTLGDKCLVKITTPGHTNDSLSYLLCDAITSSSAKLNIHYAFSGDLILMGSLGRTNFSNSSATDMYNSIKLIYSIVGDNTLICPSHDYNNEFTTSFAVELARNTLLSGIINNEVSLNIFLCKKTIMDNTITDVSGSEIMCGASIKQNNDVAIYEYNSNSLRAAMQNNIHIKLIDIREPYEFSFQHNTQFSCNVPLTRLVQFVRENQYKKQQEIVLICRSGSRSYIAAKALSRLGFDHVGHLSGGYALQ